MCQGAACIRITALHPFNGKTNVNYKITNTAIGVDPCPGTVKYSVVNFQCVWNNS